MSGRPCLRALATRLGIHEGYRSALDGSWVETSDATREALAAAMGFDAGSEASAERALANEAIPPEVESSAPVDPPRCVGVDERIGERRAFGLWANLYSVRSRRNWGFGNFGDLTDLVNLAASEGAAFVGLNPLHALANRPGWVSPYTPESRLFRNPLYLDPEAIPELAHCAEAQKRIADPELRGRIERLRQADRLDPAASETELDRVLRPLHHCFANDEGALADARRREFARFETREGHALRDVATFRALAERYEGEGCGRDWRSWPADTRSPSAPAVRAFRERQRHAIDFHAWVQFELDRQLGAAARVAREAGLAIGLYTDLALGSDPGGADAWIFRDQFASGATIGAPPDAFSQLGQDWALPPLDPHALRRSDYAFFVRLLRAGFRHAGALRIDHAMGLERLFWIPEGRPPAEGAYVSYPRNELLAILARESRSHGALVIGEDLGTLPDGFSAALAERDILSSRVLLFERDEAGAFRDGLSYPRGCLVTANTHDLPTLAALEDDEDLELRRRTGQLPSEAAWVEARAERASLRRALHARLLQDGHLDPQAGAAEEGGLAAAVTRFLGSTPSALLGISLDDLAAEREPINLPGVRAERYPSWTRRMRAPLDVLASHPIARAVLAAVPAERRRPGFSSPSSLSR